MSTQGSAERLSRDDAVLVLEIGRERRHFERAFRRAAARAVWLETSAGDDFVLLLTKQSLRLSLTG